MKVLVTGATGFVGREVLRQLLTAGHRARILARDSERAAKGLAKLARSPHKASGHPPSQPEDGGTNTSPRPSPHWAPPPLPNAEREDRSARLGRAPRAVHGEGLSEGLPATAEISIHQGDVLQPDSLRGAADGCDAAIHLVGIISEIGEETFENVHFHATQNVLAEARRAGVKRWIHMSALGARPDAPSRYHRTKWAAEEAVRASGLNWTLFRPSIIYGPGDSFVNLFARMARWSPIVPVMGSGQNQLQPVAVADVARCFVGALTQPASAGKAFDVCGPERMSFDALIDAILEALGRRRLKLHVPMPLARLQAALLEKVFPLLLRRAPPLNRDQLLMLQENNVGDGSEVEQVFNLKPREFRTGIRDYLAAQTP